MTPLESFYPRAEGLPWSRSIPGQDDSPGIVLSQDRRTPLSFGVILSQDKMTPMESFFSRTEGHPLSRSIPGLNDSSGVVLSQDRKTPLESYYPKAE